MIQDDKPLMIHDYNLSQKYFRKYKTGDNTVCIFNDLKIQCCIIIQKFKPIDNTLLYFKKPFQSKIVSLGKANTVKISFLLRPRSFAFHPHTVRLSSTDVRWRSFLCPVPLGAFKTEDVGRQWISWRRNADGAQTERGRKKNAFVSRTIFLLYTLADFLCW